MEFATFLWEAFGPEDPSKTTPRPFGNASVDGFDFDIESVLASGEDPGDLDRGYGTMVNTLRTLYDTDKSKTYYVSAAPRTYALSLNCFSFHVNVESAKKFLKLLPSRPVSASPS